MGKFRKILCISVMVCGLLGGCKKTQIHTPHTVTNIDVSGACDRYYTAPQKIESVLNYLRLLDFQGFTSLDPAVLPGDDFSITLGFSDGSSKVYRVHGSRYLCRPNGVWEKVDPERAEKLSSILDSSRSDL